MVSSPMYERLKVSMEAVCPNHGLDVWDIDHRKTLRGFKEAAERLRRHSGSQGSQGRTVNAMNQWAAESLHHTNVIRSIHEVGHTTYEVGQSTMAIALKEAKVIFPTSLDSAIEVIRGNPAVMVPSSSPRDDASVLGRRFTTDATYMNVVEVQASVQREAATQRVLSMVNGRTSHIMVLMRQWAQSSEQVK